VRLGNPRPVGGTGAQQRHVQMTLQSRPQTSARLLHQATYARQLHLAEELRKPTTWAFSSDSCDLRQCLG